MRFYDIAIFVICLNIAGLVVTSTGIFPGLSPPTGDINVLGMAQTANETSLEPSKTDTSSFFAFVFAPLKAISAFIAIMYSVLFGISGMMFWMFQCSPASCPAYVSQFILYINAAVVIIYAVSLIEILSGRYLEST